VIRGSILADVQSGSQTKLTTSKSVVILGKWIIMYIQTRSSTIAEGLCDARCQLKSSQLLYNCIISPIS